MKVVPIASVPSELLQRIRVDAAKHFDLPAEPAATAAWQILNPYSMVLCIELASEGWRERVFAKLPLRPLGPSSPLPTKMRTEFEILRTLASPAAAAGGAGTVIPLAFYADIPSVVTIEAAGRTLRKDYLHHSRLIARPGARAALIDRAALCGNWLRGFHERTSQGTGGFDLPELAAYCQIRLDRLQKRLPALLTASDIAGLLTAAAKIAQSIPGDSVGISGRHNDFASHNIIATRDGGIRVLDFTMFDHGANTFDVCNFWFELEMLKCDPSCFKPFLSNLQSVFLRSYGNMSQEQPDFQLARLRYSINRLLNTVSDSAVTRLISPHWHLSIRAIARWLRDFAAQGR